MNLEDHDRPPRGSRLDTIRADVAHRLRPINQDLSNDDFAALVDKVASVQLRFEQRNGLNIPNW